MTCRACSSVNKKIVYDEKNIALRVLILHRCDHAQFRVAPR